MKNIGFLSFMLLSFFQPITQAQDKLLSISDIWEYGRFAPRPVEGFNFMKNSNYYTRIEGGRDQSEIIEYNLTNGQATRTLYNAPKGMRIVEYDFSEDEKKILFATEFERLYRYSYQARFWVWDTETRKLQEVSAQGKQQHTQLNPQGTAVAFVRDNNLFIKDLESEIETQITQDGRKNEIINGSSDWVYEEEFAISRAFAWSPDGQYLAFLKFDETLVKEFTLNLYQGELYPLASPFKYPKAGELNALVTVHYYNFKTKTLQTVPIKGSQDLYFPRLQWTPENQLCITQLNRHQNELKLLLFSPESNSLTTLLEEKNPKFIDIHNHLSFLKNGEFLWSSDQEGYTQLYLYNRKGQMVRKISKGEYDVDVVYGIDPKQEWVYFRAATQQAYNKEVCRANLKTAKLEILSKETGSNNAQFSSNFEYFVLEYSNSQTPPQTTVIETKTGKIVRSLENNDNLKKLASEYQLGKHEFFTIKNRQGTELNAWRILPPNFDPNKKYPVLMYVYGGPGAQTVVNAWDGRNFFWFQMLAQKGYIIVSVDGRGTGGRGEAFRKATYMQLGKYEAEDQTDVARYLGGLTYVDKNRIGIFGWSFGGYLSTLCLAKAAAEFKLAIAVAPVINWKWYDTIYTERYMRTPQENPKGYEDNSPINFVKNIRGNYLLIHGMADDNVHFQNAAEMAAALVEQNIPFEQAFYPNKNHGIYGGYTRVHLYNKMTKFILENL